MSLYHHVPNKEALLRGVAQRVGSQFREGAREDIPWQAACANWLWTSAPWHTATPN